MSEPIATYVLQIRGLSSSPPGMFRLRNSYLRELEENIESAIRTDLFGKSLEFEVRILEWDEEEEDG